ncbi:hypothetical protein [Laspinema olomoucense]|uniref:Peptidase C-terminal archaeal/bacterial domain-containing protein n=1 Tax=Laspinema olomoucense D3b TaxID=2953688 RepID=A0ABT2N5L6_9CYAN|nr:hypothetical protein [Laspinema sp. D3b]MCT7977980.1 hypothetical protein [Laspinema sp. D3b]
MAVNLADLNFYRAVNPDLGGLNDPQAFQHLLNNGLNEGRVFSPYIDLNLYRAVNTDLAAAGLTSNRQLYDHLQNAGVAEGRSFSPVFNANFYRAANPDLAAAGLNNEQLLDHFRASGINEGRASAPNFSVSFYLAANPDLRAAGFNFQQALQHYVFAGMREGRTAAPGGPVAPPPPPPPPAAVAPGTTPETAGNLGILTGTRTFNDFVGNSDLNDYYRFTLDQVKDFDLVVGGMTQNANIALYIGEQKVDGSVGLGKLIGGSTRSGTEEESISRSLGAGTYFVRVFPYQSFYSNNNDTRYTLRLTATPSGIGDIAGNTPRDAFNMGVLNGTQIFTDFVGNVDLDDYYRFTLDQVQDFNLVLGGRTQDAPVQLYFGEQKVDGSFGLGQLIDGSARFGEPDSISRTLGAGTYFVRVYPRGGFSGGHTSDTKYTLRLSTGGGNTPQNSRTMELSETAISPVDNDPLINNSTFTNANESAIQTFTANGSDLTGGLGNATANLLVNESFTGGKDFTSLLATNPVETPDFSQGLALI